MDSGLVLLLTLVSLVVSLVVFFAQIRLFNIDRTLTEIRDELRAARGRQPNSAPVEHGQQANSSPIERVVNSDPAPAIQQEAPKSMLEQLFS